MHPVFPFTVQICCIDVECVAWVRATTVPLLVEFLPVLAVVDFLPGLAVVDFLPVLAGLDFLPGLADRQLRSHPRRQCVV